MTLWLKVIAVFHFVTGALSVLVVALGHGLPAQITSEMAEFDHGVKNIAIGVLILWIAALKAESRASPTPAPQETKP